jgi:raffinose/stachyose/melibiose transport system substrate-binding protein
MTRREVLRAGAAAALAAGLSGCYGVGDNRTASGTVFIWDVRTGAPQDAMKAKIAAYNRTTSGPKLDILFFENNPYKQKLQVAIGAGSPPDIIFGWGGGVLKSYVDAGAIYDLEPAMAKHPEWRQRFLPQVLAGTTFGKGIYGVPINGTQPVVLYYNKAIFDRLKLKPPETFDELLRAAATLKRAGVTPISLAGQSQWPYLMWISYLTDRIGGSEVVDAALAGEKGAWHHPAITKATATIRQLVDRCAFGSGFAALNYDSGQSSALLFTDKAGMQLMGTWDYGIIAGNAPTFVQSGKLGYAAFPAYEGGRGNPKDISGNLANFYSVASKSSDVQAAVDFLRTQILTPADATSLIAGGELPPVTDVGQLLPKAPKDQQPWLAFQADLVKNAPKFQLSWDQALPPAPAQSLLTALSKLFLGQYGPRQFADAMEAASAEVRA